MPRKHKFRKGPTFGDIFVYHTKREMFFCQACVIKNKIDIGASEVEVWEVGSAGWLKPVVCDMCKLSIPVVVDGRRR